MKHGFIGFGNLGQAIYLGLKNNKTNSFTYYSRKNKNLTINFSKNLENLLANSEYVWLCVKPKDVREIFQEIIKINNYQKYLKNKIFISVVAGLETRKIQRELFANLNIVRLMPNIQIKNRKSLTAFYTKIQNKKTILLEKELLKVGEIVKINEKEFDLFTAIFGSGPAFLLEIFNSVLNLKNKFETNIDSEIFLKLFQNTFNNLDNVEEINKLIQKITSKGGTTEAGLKYFKKKKLDRYIQNIFLEAEKKSKEIYK